MGNRIVSCSYHPTDDEDAAGPDRMAASQRQDKTDELATVGHQTDLVRAAERKTFHQWKSFRASIGVCLCALRRYVHTRFRSVRFCACVCVRGKCSHIRQPGSVCHLRLFFCHRFQFLQCCRVLFTNARETRGVFRWKMSETWGGSGVGGCC